MIRRLDTLASRIIALLLIGLGLFHVLSVWAYQSALDREIDATNEARLAERLLAIRRSLAVQPPAAREALAHELSGGPIDAHFATRPLAVVRPGDAEAASLKDRLQALEPDLARAGILVASEAPGLAGKDPHQMMASLGLGDGTFVNVTVVRSRHAPAAGHATIWSTTLMALGVIAASLVIVRWITRPLRDLGAAARAIGQAPHGRRLLLAPLAEAGPREVAETARAFNDMQRRIAELIDERTMSLAAISHDLKTPLTRLRLQFEDVAQPALKARMSADIAEMERMIDDTLAFLRGVPEYEPRRPFDIGTIVETICNDLADLGRSVTQTIARDAIAFGHPLPVKRALTNLVENAVRYGGGAHVAVAIAEGCVEVAITDDGPGIPPDRIGEMRRPFTRLDASRGEVSGSGLGLAIAGRMLDAQGGSMTLENRATGGLRVVVRLPGQSAPAGDSQRTQPSSGPAR